jgi:hypothetical protein
MLDYRQFAISDGHARGLRRESDRCIAERIATYKLLRQPTRFGPRVRTIHESLLATLGPERVMLIESTKKRAMWAYCEIDAEGRYRLRGESLEKRTGRLVNDVQQYPLIGTAHFYERLIQGFKFEGHTLITTMIDVIRMLLAEVGWVEETPVDEWPLWGNCGSAWFALDYGLAAGDIPRFGDVVLRTIIPANSLNTVRRADWESMRRRGQFVSVLHPLAPAPGSH